MNVQNALRLHCATCLPGEECINQFSRKFKKLENLRICENLRNC